MFFFLSLLLLWHCQGYRYDVEKGGWNSDKVFPLWKKRYPSPPDLLGVTRVYEREVDGPVMKAVQVRFRCPSKARRVVLETVNFYVGRDVCFWWFFHVETSFLLVESPGEDDHYC